MSANSQEWEVGTLREIAKQLTITSAYIFRSLDDEALHQQTQSELLNQVIFSLNKQHELVYKVSHNYHKRTNGN